MSDIPEAPPLPPPVVAPSVDASLSSSRQASSSMNASSISAVRLRSSAPTKVTSATGAVSYEARSSNGTFGTTVTAPSSSSSSSSSSSGSGSFFVVDTSPDEKLHHVVRGLYIGSQDAACNYDGLRTAGITHILNVATGIAPPSHANEFKYTILEVLDVPESDMTHILQQSNSIIANAIAANGACLVHCNAGVSRSATVVLSYLMNHCDMSLSSAMTLLEAARPAVQPNAGFLRQLATVDVLLAAKRNTAAAAPVS